MRVLRFAAVGLGLFLQMSVVSSAEVRSAEDFGRTGRVSNEHQARLELLSDCGDVMDYAVAAITETLVGQRYGRGWWALPWLDGGGERDEPAEYTTTNVQESGVDEMDIVKTNGRNIFFLNNEELVILKSWPAESSEILSRVSLEGYPQGLLLYEDILVVISSVWTYDPDQPEFSAYSRINFFDIGDPSAPVFLRKVDIASWVVGARLIDSDLYVILSAYRSLPANTWELVWRDDIGLPEIDVDASDEEREAAAEQARIILTPLVREIVDQLRPEDILPLMRDSAAEVPTSRLLLECNEIYRTAETSTLDILSVMHLDLNDPESDLDGAGILANGFSLYASARNIYVGQSSWWWFSGWGAIDVNSDIHVFDISGTSGEAVRYSASGEVPGWIQNQFSFSEYNGYLRVATTMQDWLWGLLDEDGDSREQGSVISVLKDNGEGDLVLHGQLRGIAPGEQIYASRMMGDRGYLVTFERVDPLFTIDLSDPENPEIAGMLKIPGFSSYLHPIDETHLLSVGMAGDDDGTIRGLAVNLFDVGDFSQPVLLHSFELENSDQTWSWSETFADHHAFTLSRNTLSIPAYLYGTSGFFSGLLVLDVDIENGFEQLGWIDHGDFSPGSEAWYPDFARMRRSIYIEDFLFSLSDRGLKVNDLEDPDILRASIPFFENSSPGSLFLKV